MGQTRTNTLTIKANWESPVRIEINPVEVVEQVTREFVFQTEHLLEKEDCERLRNNTIYLTWATSWIWAKIVDFLIENSIDFIPIWSRQKNKLEEIVERKKQIRSKQETPTVPYSHGDLFDKDSEAYKHFMEEVPKWGIAFCNAAIDMDPIPTYNLEIDPRTWEKWWNNISEEEKKYYLKYTEDSTIDPRTWEKWEKDISEKEQKSIQNKLIIKDTINPETWKPWEEWISDKEKKEIRRNLAQKQIDFYTELFERLLERESTEPLTIVFTNSIISKFYEHSTFYSEKSRSEYGRSKNEITKLIWKYSEKLEEKWVYIKNVFLWVSDTPMFRDRWTKSAENTARIVEWLGCKLELGWDAIVVWEKPLSAEKVAECLLKIANDNPKKLPRNINLFLKKHTYKILNDEIIREYSISKNSVKEVIIENIISWELDWDNETVKINKKTINFLRDLRELSLSNYVKDNSEFKEKLKRMMKEIVQRWIDNKKRGLEELRDDSLDKFLEYNPRIKSMILDFKQKLSEILGDITEVTKEIDEWIETIIDTWINKIAQSKWRIEWRKKWNRICDKEKTQTIDFNINSIKWILESLWIDSENPSWEMSMNEFIQLALRIKENYP